MAKTFSVTATLATPRYVHTATLLADGSVLVVGGAGVTGFVATAESYK